MVAELDKTEARRKAMRNGEEDPFIVAQRYLNIYRQIHIFSPERREAFDKMLLELSPNIRGIFSSLPGGSTLQDYVDDLAEKAGVEKSVSSVSNAPISEEANQQAQILATALAKAQTQNPPAAAVSGGSAKLSMDKDFAGEFAKIIGGVLEQQSSLQKDGLEKITSDLTKTQLFIAKTLKENKDEQRSEIDTLCKAIIQSQTALSSSLAALLERQTPIGHQGNDSAKELIEVVLDGQRQINSRLDKVEEYSLNKANDNIQLIAAFEKSQNEMIKSLANLQVAAPIVAKNTEEDDRRLAQIISQSQENLVKVLMSTNLQQNHNSASQANNNANNIQINTSDNSAQMMLLIEKIASLQSSNEQNLEKALTKAIEAQCEMYNKISREQTKELAEIIAKGVKSVQPVYVAKAPQATVSFEVSQEKTSGISETENFVANMGTNDAATYFNDYAPEPQETEIKPVEEKELVSEDNFDDVKSVDDVAINLVVSEATTPAKKKRKRKKKKKSDIADTENISDINYSEQKEDEIFLVDELPPVSDFSIENINTETTENIGSYPEDETIFPQVADNANTQSDTDNNETVDNQDIPKEIDPVIEDTYTEPKSDWGNISLESGSYAPSGEDWGFVSSSDEVPPTTDNDNQEGQDWEWAYVEEDDEGNYVEVEAIGSNSYIYSGDLYTQEQASSDSPIIYGSSPLNIKNGPQIFNDNDDDDFNDPYQNSILKD